MDGSANAKRGVGLILKGPDGQQYRHARHFGFKVTNNETEYKALLSGIRIALELQVRNIEVFTDSQLVIGHINRDYEARDTTLSKNLFEAR